MAKATTHTDLDTLKLTVDERGHVWYLRGDSMPRNSGYDVTSFLKSKFLEESKNIRVVGISANSELLHCLYEKRLQGEIESLQVCSPLCCESAEDRKDPQLLLFRMRSYNLPSSLGGWHEFGIKDYPNYLLAEHFNRQPEATDYVRRVVTAHAAWPALSFIESLDVDVCAKLLALLIDPRWYIDTDTDPNRGSRMEQFLGLNPRTQASLARSELNWRSRRCKLVLDCWKTVSQSKLTISSPRNFLWRAWASKGGGDRGDLIASKLFISFLRLTWTQAMCDGPQADRLFVPKFFFAREDECRAYEEHIKKFKTDST
jgi:hypothetical protein